ncbi:MAG: pyruvate kinase, partial [Ruminococcus sp.]|nr:pyruvate kinase [Ruminococcus sp.]
MRKTKIVCTIGPATDDENIMRELMLAGMNVARFNFSHGDYETHEQRFRMVEKLRKELDLPIATLLDTKGPEIRLGKFVDNKPVEIYDGDLYVLTTDDVLCDNQRGSISFKKLPRDVSIGTRILINDGVIELLAEKVTKNEITCRVIHGGVL